MGAVAAKRKKVARRKALLKQARLERARRRRQLRHANASVKRREAKLAAAHEELKKAKLADHGAAKGVDWGLDQARLGRVESPPFSNDSPWMREQFTRFGFAPGHAWCQYMANAVVVHGNGPVIPSGYTVQVVQWAREGRFGLRMASRATMKVGDMVFYKFPGVSSDFCDHVGVYVGGGRVLEGNTSPGNTGSQNNGGGLYVRSLSDPRRGNYVVAVVRPTYST